MPLMPRTATCHCDFKNLTYFLTIHSETTEQSLRPQPNTFGMVIRKTRFGKIRGAAQDYNQLTIEPALKTRIKIFGGVNL